MGFSLLHFSCMIFFSLVNLFTQQCFQIPNPLFMICNVLHTYKNVDIFLLLTCFNWSIYTGSVRHRLWCIVSSRIYQIFPHLSISFSLTISSLKLNSWSLFFSLSVFTITVSFRSWNILSCTSVSIVTISVSWSSFLFLISSSSSVSSFSILFFWSLFSY